MRIAVKFDIELPRIERPATDAEIEEWLRFELHDNGSMRMANPFADRAVEPIFGTFEWERKP